MVPVERIELPTFGLQNHCTTAVLHRRTKKFRPCYSLIRARGQILTSSIYKLFSAQPYNYKTAALPLCYAGAPKDDLYAVLCRSVQPVLENTWKTQTFKDLENRGFPRLLTYLNPRPSGVYKTAALPLCYAGD
jgi:hypothetical protein